jgi:hypothetical protein
MTNIRKAQLWSVCVLWATVGCRGPTDIVTLHDADLTVHLLVAPDPVVSGESVTLEVAIRNEGEHTHHLSGSGCLALYTIIQGTRVVPVPGTFAIACGAAVWQLELEPGAEHSQELLTQTRVGGDPLRPGEYTVEAAVHFAVRADELYHPQKLRLERPLFVVEQTR